MRGDQTLFARTDALDASWRVVDPVLGKDRAAVQPYAPGSWGPASSATLIDGAGWREPE